MSLIEILISSVAVAAGALVQGSIGFGLALVVVPVLSLLETGLLPTTMLVLAFPLTLSMAVHERRSIDYRELVHIIPTRLLGTVVGAWIVVIVSEQRLSIVMGAAILLAVGLSLLAAEFEAGRGSRIAAGFLSGVMGTAAGVGGPPLALAYQRRRGPELRATLAASFVVGTAFSIGALWVARHVELRHFVVAAELVPALLLGLYVATRFRSRLEGRWLRICVLTFAALSGVAAIAKGLG